MTLTVEPAALAKAAREVAADLEKGAVLGAGQIKNGDQPWCAIGHVLRKAGVKLKGVGVGELSNMACLGKRHSPLGTQSGAVQVLNDLAFGQKYENDTDTPHSPFVKNPHRIPELAGALISYAELLEKVEPK